jgi:hypothetical protein
MFREQWCLRPSPTERNCAFVRRKDAQPYEISLVSGAKSRIWLVHFLVNFNLLRKYHFRPGLGGTNYQFVRTFTSGLTGPTPA